MEGLREPVVDADSCVIPPDHKGADWSGAFLAAKAKLLLLTTNGQGKKERANSRFAPRLETNQRKNANGSTMDVVVGVKGGNHEIRREEEKFLRRSQGQRHPTQAAIVKWDMDNH